MVVCVNLLKQKEVFDKAMSGMLYSLSIEPMLHNVSGFIDGLFLPYYSSNFISSAYADDIIIFIKNQEDINKFGQIVKTYEDLSCQS